MPSAQFDFPPDPAGNPVDFRYRPLNHPLLLHEEVPDSVEDDMHLRRRLGLVLQHLAAHGRTSIVKGCGGVNQGWRRSPLGGNRGMQYYLWWAPDGSRPTGGARRSEELNGSSIWVRAVRHHDDHTPLDIGSDASDYYSIGQNDIASHDDSFISPPDTENQALIRQATSTPSGWCTGIRAPARPPRCGRRSRRETTSVCCTSPGHGS